MIVNRHRFKGVVIFNSDGKPVTRSRNLNVFALHKKKTGLTPCHVHLFKVAGGEGQLLALYSNGDKVTVDFQSYEVMQDYIRRKHWEIEELLETNLEERVEKMTKEQEVKVHYTARLMNGTTDEYIYDFTDKETPDELEVTIKVRLTPNDIENIIVTAFEGGINYWASVPSTDFDGNNVREILGGKPKDMPFSQWITHLLLNGKHVKVVDREDADEEFKLDLEAVKKGFAMMVDKHNFDLDTFDADGADGVIQYGLFGKYVYG